MNVEQLLVRETGRWVEAASMWETQDDAPATVAPRPVKATRRCHRCSTQQPLAAFLSERGKVQTFCQTCRAQSAARRYAARHPSAAG